MDVTLIHNDDAGDDEKLTPNQLVGLIEQAGHIVAACSIKTREWQVALTRARDLVAVAGGDGTVGAVARRMVGSPTPLAVLPAGTANNIAKSLGCAGWDTPRLIAGWSCAERASFNAGWALGPWGMRHFIEGIGIGLFTEALPWISSHERMHHFPLGSDRMAAAIRQLRDYLQGCVAQPLNARLDGRTLSGRYVLFEVMNTRYVGPNLLLAPGAAHGEDRLHVACVTERQRDELDKYLAEWRHDSPWPAGLEVQTGRRVELEWTGYSLHLDDSTWPREGDSTPAATARIEIGIARAALCFLVPAQAPAARDA